MIAPPVSALLSAASVTEFAYLTPRGEPLCWPVTPFWQPEREVLGIATGLAYPDKAHYARRHPQVSALFRDGDRHVLIQGRAVVLDEDLQANTDRYIREMRAKFRSARVALNPLLLPRLDFYLPRLWIEVNPVRVLSRSGAEPAPREAAPPRGGDGYQAGVEASDGEVQALHRWVRRVGQAVVTMVGDQGFPAVQRTRAWPEPDGSVDLESAPGTGPAALTMHTLGLGGVRLDALLARGQVHRYGGQLRFLPRRVVGMFGREPGSRAPFASIFPLSQLPRAGAFRATLTRELSRRGARLPELRLPP